MTKKQKLEKSKRKRRFFSILMILVTGLILSASTYAWFTANKNVDVEAMNVNVSASTGLQISAKPVTDGDWKTYVSATDFNAVNTNQLPESISPVSTIGKVANSTTATASVPKGRMFMYRGSLDNKIDSSTHEETYYLTTSESAEGTGTSTASTGGDYMAFDLYVRSGVDGTVYLKSPSKITLNNGTATDKGNGIENATRVAFVMEGLNTNSNALFDTVSSYECATNNSIANSDGDVCYPYTIWEPNSTSHTSVGVTSATDSKTFGFNSADLYESDGTTFKALTYYGIGSAQKNIPFASSNGLVKDTAYQSYFSAVTTQKSEDDIDDSARIPAFQVKVGVNKIRIYVWVEGQDVDCEDKASNSTISVDLAFSLESHA